MGEQMTDAEVRGWLPAWARSERRLQLCHPRKDDDFDASVMRSKFLRLCLAHAQARKELAEASNNFDALSQQYLSRAHAAEIALASATDLCNTYARENGLHEATSLAGLKHVIGSLGMRLNALRAERDALDEEARRYKREVDARREAEDEWLATRADLDDRAQKAEAEVATLRAAIGTPEVYAGVITEVVEAELEQCRKALADASVRYTHMQCERDALAEKLAKKERTIQRMTEGVESWRQKVAELEAKLADAEAHAADFGRDCERLKARIDADCAGCTLVSDMAAREDALKAEVERLKAAEVR